MLGVDIQEDAEVGEVAEAAEAEEAAYEVKRCDSPVSILLTQ